MHPLYDDEQLVAKTTDEHLAGGRTVLQMFQFPGGEEEHSLRVFDLLGEVREGARVLSLGCGVGGMERYWHQARPDLTFELVNVSQAQLDRCLCPGKKVHMDAEHYSTEEPFDIAVLGYVLGHLSPIDAVQIAGLATKPSGWVLVLDVFDGSRRFDHELHYNTPAADDMRMLGMVRMAGPRQLKLSRFFEVNAPWVEGHVTPGIWMGRGHA